MERKWNKAFLSRLIVCIFSVVWSLSASSLQEQALFVQHTENGPIIVQRQGIPSTISTRTVQDPAVVWSHYLTGAIYNTTSNTIDGYVFAGTYQNPPKGSPDSSSPQVLQKANPSQLNPVNCVRRQAYKPCQ